MNKPIFLPGEVLLPKPGADLAKWAVLACDQFTSQPEYWQRADALVGGAPSTLRIILPEAYLEDNAAPRIAAIHEAMEAYAAAGLQALPACFVYVERTISTGVRQGLVGCVDLDAYSYEKGAQPRIRPSENTVVERIPPRLAVRRGAPLESPHILMLCDDPAGTVIAPLAAKKGGLKPLYDVELMLGGGRLQGWAVTDAGDIAAVQAALAALEEPAAFAARYPGAQTAPFALAVGDGNHSLATAKAAWEELKPTLAEAERQGHPARYCLVELENIHDPANCVEPIHRVVFGQSGEEVLRAVAAYAAQTGATMSEAGEGTQRFTLLYGDEGKNSVAIGLTGAPEPLCAGTVDAVLALCPGARVDYVHGEASVRELVAGGAVGVLLPAFEKGDLFRGVALGGVLPKKTFSMGHAEEKRYYMECRKIL